MRLILEATIHKVRNATEEEKAICPEMFRCFNCQNQLPRSKLGGIKAGEYLCCNCRPYLDDWSVNAQKRFDNRDKRSYASPKPQLPSEKYEDDQIEAGFEDWLISKDRAKTKQWNSNLKYPDYTSSSPWGWAITQIVKSSFDEKRRDWIWVLPLLIEDRYWKERERRKR
jgi:hypothetical protein